MVSAEPSTAAQMPNARPRSAPSKAWVMSASEPGTSSAPAAPWIEAEDDQPLERRRQAAQRGRGREPDQADREDPPPAVVVGQRAGQDQQRGEDRQVAADDVGLALEDADSVAGSSWPMCLSAALTMVPSRKTAPEPMTVQIRVQRWREVMSAAVSQRRREFGQGPG